MLGGEHPAPGLPQDAVVGADVEVGEQVVEFGEEERGGEEFGWGHGRGRQVRGAAAAELVVEDCGDGVRGFGEGGQGEEVVVRDSGAAVEDHEGGGGG